MSRQLHEHDAAKSRPPFADTHPGLFDSYHLWVMLVEGGGIAPTPVARELSTGGSTACCLVSASERALIRLIRLIRPHVPYPPHRCLPLFIDYRDHPTNWRVRAPRCSSVKKSTVCELPRTMDCHDGSRLSHSWCTWNSTCPRSVGLISCTSLFTCCEHATCQTGQRSRSLQVRVLTFPCLLADAQLFQHNDKDGRKRTNALGSSGSSGSAAPGEAILAGGCQGGLVEAWQR